MQRFQGTTLLDRSFHLSITLKGIDGILEILGSVFLLTASAGRLDAFVTKIAQDTLSKDPHDFVATLLLHLSHRFTGSTQYFMVFYFLSHGLAKVILVVALWMNRMWAYPAMILMLLGFIGYQVYRMTFALSWWLAALTVFDAIIILLTWAEYKKQRSLKTKNAGR
ncbi:MAG TPA: DUF2127 domain-containing protein [Candidatus Dormibacteraeota bacterium]|nr:DUF2127 domain-containing protein [Candidatus Dormibacteraeota bacterium]